MPSDLDLASLLASRLCHDVVGPVGAIQNGLELISEDSAMTDMAMDLIRKSAAQATAKLQYARMAYGTAGGADMLDPAEAGRLTGAMFEGERADLSWGFGSGSAAPRVSVKLAMLLATFALGAVPRGGTVEVEYGEDESVTVRAKGDTVREPPFVELAVGGGPTNDPRAVQAALIHHLAAEAGKSVRVDADSEQISFVVS